MDTQDLFLEIGREFHLTFDQVSEICGRLLERFQEITLSTREQIAREILKNFDSGIVEGQNDCSCEEGYDPCYYCGANDYTGIAAAIARGNK